MASIWHLLFTILLERKTSIGSQELSRSALQTINSPHLSHPGMRTVCNGVNMKDYSVCDGCGIYRISLTTSLLEIRDDFGSWETRCSRIVCIGSN